MVRAAGVKRPLGEEQVPLAAAVGRIVAQEVRSPEDVPAPSGDAIEVKLRGPAPAGQHLRPRGDDFASGYRLATPGELLRPEHVSALATVGVASVFVRKRARIALVTT